MKKWLLWLIWLIAITALYAVVFARATNARADAEPKACESMIYVGIAPAEVNLCSESL